MFMHPLKSVTFLVMVKTAKVTSESNKSLTSETNSELNVGVHTPEIRPSRSGVRMKLSLDEA